MDVLSLISLALTVLFWETKIGKLVANNYIIFQ
jgi:hypothetical protein